MGNPSLKSQAKKGLFWSAFGQFSTTGISFVIGIILARLLSPEEYGVISMLAIFLAISTSITDSGFSQALIRKTDCNDVDRSTVFYFNIIASILMYALCFIFSPHIATFYEMPVLTPLLRVFALLIVVNSFGVVQRALYIAKIDFRTTTIATAVASVLSGCLGIAMAYYGYSYWSLVWQQIAAASITILFLWIFSPWRPILAFSWKSFHQLFSFGSKLLFSGLIDTVYGNLRPLFIGKYYNAESLGLYSKASLFCRYSSSNITGILQNVSYPILCKLQLDTAQLARSYRKLIRLASFIVFPICLGVSAVSQPLILTLIGEKWMFSATLLSIMGFAAMWYPVSSINLNLLKVMGRSDLFLQLEIYKKIFGVLILIITLPMGLIAMCYGGIVMTLGCILINTYYTGKLIHVGFLMQMRDVLPTFLLSTAMFILVKLFLCVIPVKSPLIQLILSSLLGGLFFLGCAKLFRFVELKETWNFLHKK